MAGAATHPVIAMNAAAIFAHSLRHQSIEWVAWCARCQEAVVAQLTDDMGWLCPFCWGRVAVPCDFCESMDGLSHPLGSVGIPKVVKIIDG